MLIPAAVLPHVSPGTYSQAVPVYRTARVLKLASSTYPDTCPDALMPVSKGTRLPILAEVPRACMVNVGALACGVCGHDNTPSKVTAVAMAYRFISDLPCHGRATGVPC